MAEQPEQNNEETGRLAGFGAGALTGAHVGSVLIPIPFVGTFTGALIGGALGSKAGKRFGPTILNAVDNLTQSKPATATHQQATSIPITTPTDSAGDSDLLSQLERLGQLRSQGLLTEDEFSAAKAQLLKR
jgi:phage tail tape-measure protein